MMKFVIIISIIVFCGKSYANSIDVNSKTMIEKIYNQGERLIPGETHDLAESIRHKSSYKFFRKVIESDILSDPSMLKNKIKILDIGCGVGHGTLLLSGIIGVEITAIDISKESIAYAKQNYSAENIEYVTSSVEDFIELVKKYDYIVSRHAIEHIKDGINLVSKFGYTKRLIVNVPFNEADGNPYHLVNWITEKDFDSYPNKEFFL